MNNSFHKNVAYLNYNTSSFGKPNDNSSSIPNSLVNIIKNRTLMLDKHFIPNAGGENRENVNRT